MILDFAKHWFAKAQELYGDRWLGFAENDPQRWLEAGAFKKIEINVVACEEPPPHFETVLASGQRWALRKDLNPGSVTQMRQELFAVLPGEPKSPHVGHSQAGDDEPQSFHVAFCELAFLHRVLSPIHQLRQCDFMVQIRGDLVRSRYEGELSLVAVIEVPQRGCQIRFVL